MKDLLYYGSAVHFPSPVALFCNHLCAGLSCEQFISNHKKCGLLLVPGQVSPGTCEDGDYGSGTSVSSCSDWSN